mgnify:CR=1 FL=1|jgi:hypothetical protein
MGIYRNKIAYSYYYNKYTILLLLEMIDSKTGKIIESAELINMN